MGSTVLTQLGSRIREKRKALGLTQEALADRAQIDRSYLGGVERGERNVTFTVLTEICTALGCDVGEIAAGIPEVSR